MYVQDQDRVDYQGPGAVVIRQTQADLVYPIVSDIPVMLIDEALPASSVGR
jgi:uncharacterized protein YbaR (Trm112 family)